MQRDRNIVAAGEEKQRERESGHAFFLYQHPLLREMEISAVCCCSMKYYWTLFACGAVGNTIGTVTVNNGREATQGLVFKFSQGKKTKLLLKFLFRLIFSSLVYYGDCAGIHQDTKKNRRREKNVYTQVVWKCL